PRRALRPRRRGPRGVPGPAQNALACRGPRTAGRLGEREKRPTRAAPERGHIGLIGAAGNCPEHRTMAATDFVLALTGASGAPYGVRLLAVLLETGRTVHLTISPAAVQVIEQELDRRVDMKSFRLPDLLGRTPANGQVVYHHH